MSTPWTAADLAAKGYGPDGRRTSSTGVSRQGTRSVETVRVKDAPAAGGSPAPKHLSTAALRRLTPEQRLQIEVVQPERTNKFGAVRTMAPASWGGERLADSKAGAELCRTLEVRKQAGGIIDWFEEVSLPIGVSERGKVIRYRADAMALLGYVDAPDGGEPALVVRFYDRKRRDHDTDLSAAKRAALRNRGLNVEVVT